MKTIRLVLAIAILALSGCAITEKTHRIQDTQDQTTQDLLKKQANYQTVPPPTPQNAIINDGFWVDTKPVRTAAATSSPQLPPVLDADVVVGRSGNPTLLEIATLLTKTAGIPVGFAPDAQQIIGSNHPGAGGSDGTISDVLPYRGKLRSLLDLIASRNNLFWRWTGDRVEFFEHETRSFVIAALSGNLELRTQVGATQTTGGGSTGNITGDRISTSSSGQGQNGITAEAKASVWDSVKQAVTAMKSKDGVVAVTEATGMITVTDTPTVLHTVDAYIRSVNEALRKQVMVSVDIYAVQANEAEGFAISWDLIYKALSHSLNLSYAGGIVPPGSNSFSIISDPNGTGPMAGSQGVIGALSTLGRTTMLTNATVVTMSGQPVPVQVTREQSYLAEVTAGTGSIINGSTGPTLTPGVVTTGFSLNVLPRVMENGDILLQYSLDLSSLDALTSVSSGGVSIQVPTKSNRNFLSRINMRSGQSLILGGLKQVSTQTDRQGPFSPDMWVFGGSDNSRLDQAYLVVVITPNILDRNVN
jgi:type IVB pilus formation R64 PilN family outer membrane protein